eukprot:gene22851-35022_t
MDGGWAMNGLLRSWYYGKEEKKKKTPKPSGPDPYEVEARLDDEWLVENPMGATLSESWSAIPWREARAATNEDLNYDSADNPKMVITPEEGDGPAFRELFAEVLKDWQPALPANHIIPLCYLTHLSHSLRALVDALTRVDTSIPRGRAPAQYHAVIVTLDCLEIAVRSPYNVRYLIERGLLHDLAKLMEAVVASLWPLALTLQYLREVPMPASEVDKRQQQPQKDDEQQQQRPQQSEQDHEQQRRPQQDQDQEQQERPQQEQHQEQQEQQEVQQQVQQPEQQQQPKGFLQTKEPKALGDKLSQVMLRVTVLDRCMALVRLLVVRDRKDYNVEGDSFSRAPPEATEVDSPSSMPEEPPGAVTSALREPLRRSDTVAACFDGSVPLAKIVAWSLYMLQLHVVHSLLQVDDKKETLFRTIDSMLLTLLAVVHPSSKITKSESCSRLARLLEAEIPTSIIITLQWPVEASFRRIGTNTSVTNECHQARCEPDKYVLPDLPPSRREWYSKMQLIALDIAAALIADHPSALSKMAAEGFFEAVAQSSVWHIIAFSPPNACKLVEECIVSDDDLPSPFYEEPLVRADSELESPDLFENCAQVIDEYRRLTIISEIDGLEPLQKPGTKLLDMLRNQPPQLLKLFGALDKVAKCAPDVRQYVQELAAKKLSKKGSSFGSSSTLSANTGSPLAGSGKDGAGNAGSLLDQDEAALWEAADRLEMISLDIYSDLLPKRTVVPPAASNFQTQAVTRDPAAAVVPPNHSILAPSTHISPAPVNLSIGLLQLRHHFQLQIYTLSTLLEYARIQFEQESCLRTTRQPEAARSPSGKVGNRIDMRGNIVSCFDVMVKLNVQRVLLETDVFYLSAFDSVADKKPRELLRPRAADAPDKTIRLVLRQVTRYVLQTLASHLNRDVHVDVRVTLEQMQHFRFSPHIVADLASLLLTICRKRQPMTGQLHLTSAIEFDRQMASTILNTLSEAFWAQNSIIGALKGEAWPTLGKSALPVAGGPQHAPLQGQQHASPPASPKLYRSCSGSLNQTGRSAARQISRTRSSLASTGSPRAVDGALAKLGTDLFQPTRDVASPKSPQ